MIRSPSRLDIPVCLLLVALVRAPVAAQISVEPRSIDFGERGQNERPEATIVLRNSGTRPVAIKEIKKSCDCIAVAPAQISTPIPVAGTIPLRITMGSGRAMGRLDKYVTIVAADPARTELKVPVSMRVFDDFEMEPRDVRLEGAVGGQPETAKVDLRLRKGRPLRPFNVEVQRIEGRFGRPSDRFLKASVERIPEGKRISILLDPKHPEGLISAEIVASLDGKALYIPLNGDMFAWIKVSPNFINFSRIEAENPSSAVREVALTSTDGTAFRVLEIVARPFREGEKTLRLEFTVGPAAPAGGAAPAAAPPLPSAPSTVQKIVCRAVPTGKAGETFFGTVTVRTDHPRKPEIALKYSGFFAPFRGQAPK